jgi:hypothetical protein
VVGTRSPGKGQYMEIYEKIKSCTMFLKKLSHRTNDQTMYQNRIFLDETGCVPNEKMMPDDTVMVPDLETGKKVKKIDIFGRQMWWYPQY